jgi:hypothetical protein
VITYLDRAVIVEPRKKICGVPVSIRTFPVPIRPDHIRLVSGRQGIRTVCYLNKFIVYYYDLIFQQMFQN